MTNKKSAAKGVSRRDALKLSGLAMGGLAMSGMLGGCTSSDASDTPVVDEGEQNSYFESLDSCYPGEPLAENEMRITFMGSWYFQRLAQACNSVFVEVGGGPDGTAADQFVFDCGSGITAKYNAMRIPMSKLDKIFVTHLHGDHMSDLTHIYCFGPAYDRKSPLYVWGPSNSGLTYYDPYRKVNRGPYEDGTKAFCENFRKAMRWHTESFSFQTSAIDGWTRPGWLPDDASPVGDDAENDAYALYPIELDWTVEGGVAYDNPTTGVKVTHFPAIHDRMGSISYKLEWKGLSMIFTGDTKPGNYVIRQANSGVDVLIHEMTTPPEVWVEKFSGLDPDTTDPATWAAYVQMAKNVQDSSHTVQKAFGYILSQLNVAPRLAVGTHFPATDDTIKDALSDIRLWYKNGDVTVATDLMVLNVSKTQIHQRKAVVSDYVWPNIPQSSGATYEMPLYNDGATSDPLAQLDPDRDEITGEPWEER